jgi:hypothetical protein
LFLLNNLIRKLYHIVDKKRPTIGHKARGHKVIGHKTVGHKTVGHKEKLPRPFAWGV